MATSWRTTLAGIIAFLGVAGNALLTAYNTGAFTGKTGWQLVAAIGLLILGLVSKDSNVTGGTVSNGKFVK